MITEIIAEQLRELQQENQSLKEQMVNMLMATHSNISNDTKVIAVTRDNVDAIIEAMNNNATILIITQ